LDIAYVAAGQLDAHTETLFACDVTVAGLIPPEADAIRGNLVAAPGGTPPDLYGVTVFFQRLPSIMSL